MVEGEGCRNSKAMVVHHHLLKISDQVPGKVDEVEEEGLLRTEVDRKMVGTLRQEDDHHVASQAMVMEHLLRLHKSNVRALDKVVGDHLLSLRSRALVPGRDMELQRRHMLENNGLAHEEARGVHHNNSFHIQATVHLQHLVKNSVKVPDRVAHHLHLHKNNVPAHDRAVHVGHPHNSSNMLRMDKVMLLLHHSLLGRHVLVPDREDREVHHRYSKCSTPSTERTVHKKK